MKRIVALSLFIAFFLPLTLSADDVKLYIVYTEGRGLTLIRDGQSQYVDLTAQKAVGMELKAGDTVNIEARSSIEVQLFPTMTVFKALASSSFTVKAVYNNGNYDLDIAFGRVRTKTDDRIPSGAFFYNGVEIAANGGGTDFGYDLVFADGKQLIPVISCLTGALDVTKTAAAAGSLGSAALGTAEMLTVGNQALLAKRRLAADVDSFWQKNDFKTRPSRVAKNETAIAKNDATPTPPKDNFLTPPSSPSPTPSPALSPTPMTSPSPSPIATPSPTPVKDVTAAGQKLSKNGIATPPVVENTEGALGDREKLTALNEKDIAVNPDLSKKQDQGVIPSPAPSPEPKKDVPLAKADDKTNVPTPSPTPTPTPTPAPTPSPAPAPTPAPAPAPAPAAPAQIPIGFSLDLGLEVNYLTNYSFTSITIPPPLDLLASILNLVMQLRGGLAVNADIMFFDLIGAGITTGVFYHPIVTVDAFYNPTFTHEFSIPVMVNLRFAILFVFIQAYGGIVINAGLDSSNTFNFNYPITYMMGAKGGFKLGGLILYANLALYSDTLGGMFSPTTGISIGGGIAFKIF